jgi:hypothetical protein
MRPFLVSTKVIKEAFIRMGVVDLRGRCLAKWTHIYKLTYINIGFKRREVARVWGVL